MVSFGVEITAISKISYSIFIFGPTAFHRSCGGSNHSLSVNIKLTHVGYRIAMNKVDSVFVFSPAIFNKSSTLKYWMFILKSLVRNAKVFISTIPNIKI